MQDSFKVLIEATISENVKKAACVLYGSVTEEADELVKSLEEGKKLPFKKLIYCDIDNPLALGQPALTFEREVLSAAIYPKLLNSTEISQDAKDRVTKILESVSHPQAIGAYTTSQGLRVVRESIRRFIEERDQVSADIKKILLTNGASDAVRTIFNILIRDSKDSVMIPIPHYPIYKTLITLLKGRAVPYYLDEINNWALDMKSLEQSCRRNKLAKQNIRAIVVINPGNPSGQVMSLENLQDIVRFCHKNRIMIIADETYQDNVYGNKPFISLRKVLHDLDRPYDQVELISLNSISRGIMGECGLRGGYMELENINDYAFSQFIKLRSISLCSNTMGQIAMEVMVNPPKIGLNTSAVVELYEKEKAEIFNGLKSRARLLVSKLNSIPRIKAKDIEGGMCVFPRVFLTKEAIGAAKVKKLEPDVMYCVEALKQTGLVIAPGSGFGQKQGIYHVRITNLIYDIKEFDAALEEFKKFNEVFFALYPPGEDESVEKMENEKGGLTPEEVKEQVKEYKALKKDRVIKDNESVLFPYELKGLFDIEAVVKEVEELRE